MATTEHHILNGICLRLIHGLAPSRPEVLVLVRWMAGRPDLFGALPPVIVQTRRGLVLHSQGVEILTSHLADRLAAMPELHDTALVRLDTIAAHLDLTFEETTILRFLALQHRQGPLADFTAMPQREIGLSTEAVIALCCNLDEPEVWNALAPQGRLVTIGLVQTDSTLAILRDDPYTLSGLQKEASMPESTTTVAGDATGTHETRQPPVATPASPKQTSARMPEPAPAPDSEAIATRAREAERDRVSTIYDLTGRLNLERGFAEDLVKRGITVDESRRLILDQVAARSNETRTFPHVSIPLGGRDERINRRDAVANVLLHRYSPTLFPLEDAARSIAA